MGRELVRYYWLTFTKALRPLGAKDTQHEVKETATAQAVARMGSKTFQDRQNVEEVDKK